MTQREEQYDRTHEAIFASAGRLLRSRGLAASVAEVMRGAGLTVGGFYAHFGSKEDLFTATIRRTHELWTKLLAVTDRPTPRDRIGEVLRRYLSRAHRDDPGAGCLMPASVADVTRAGEPYRGALAETIDRYARDLAPLFAGAPPEGGKGAETRQRALATIALMYGALGLARALEGTPLSDELLRAARAVGAAAAEAPLD